MLDFEYLFTDAIAQKFKAKKNELIDWDHEDLFYIKIPKKLSL